MHKHIYIVHKIFVFSAFSACLSTVLCYFAYCDDSAFITFYHTERRAFRVLLQ